MKLNPVFRVILLFVSLCAFGLVGCAAPDALSQPPRIDAAEAARHVDAPTLGGSGTRSSGSSGSSTRGPS